MEKAETTTVEMTQNQIMTIFATGYNRGWTDAIAKARKVVDKEAVRIDQKLFIKQTDKQNGGYGHRPDDDEIDEILMQLGVYDVS